MSSTPRFSPTLLSALLLPGAIALGQGPADLVSTFDADGENWSPTHAGTLLAWEATGGADGAYLAAQGDGTLWHFQSPAAWSGDWSGYLSLSFDLAIPSRHYATNDRENMVEIEGTNGNTMTWNGPTPIWSWTHFEVSLDPVSFGVDQATFDAIMADVAELRILGELNDSTDETVGLDNVIVSSEPIEVFSEDLVERFTYATIDPDDNSLAGWSPVDDVTFYHHEPGRPSFCLHGDDWRDGRLFKIASPPSWSGDWSGFTELSFDFLWNSGGDMTDVTLVTIFGANGQTLTWNTDLLDNQWQHHSVPLTPATFGVDQATLDGVMAFVNKIWIHGEYDSGDDQAYLDNVMLLTAPFVPVAFQNNLISRFGADDEGWLGFENCAVTWEPTGGRVDGYIVGEDTGGGVARFHSPDSWAGDWRNFTELRFFLKTFGANRAGFDGTVEISTWDETTLSVTLPRTQRSWSPFTIDLTPETFGVTPQEFDTVMSNVASLRIRADLVNGTGAVDRTGLDEVSLLIDPSLASAPPDRMSDFETDAEGWRGYGMTSGDIWEYDLDPADHQATGGNPGGCITLADVSSLSGWFTPEAWSGDWRGYETLAFDFNILQGTSLLAPGWMIALVSTQGTLYQDAPSLPEPLTWKHYEFALTPAAFGVTPEVFDLHMRDVVALCIRSEWINGGELEALDNVLLATNDEAYQLWLAGYLTPAELADPQIAGSTVDADGDGATNGDEFLALTDPTDPLSRFTASARVDPAGIFIDFETKSGRVYQVYRSTTLAPPWDPVGTLITGDDTLHSYLDATGDPAAFFYVEVSLPN